jgi:K+-transporting ATPase ATPase C chain
MMFERVQTAVVLLAVLAFLTGVVYPLAMTGIAQLFFPVRANGSIIVKNGKPVGSALIGQYFYDPKYFRGRPSATYPYPYNASSSSGSNQGQSNPSLIEAVRERTSRLKAVDPENDKPIPVDLVTASASGLDPHISPAAAQYQVKRVAAARGMDERKVQDLVAANVEQRLFGILGEPRINVLKLNLALDEMK